MIEQAHKSISIAMLCDGGQQIRILIRTRHQVGLRAWPSLRSDAEAAIPVGKMSFAGFLPTRLLWIRRMAAVQGAKAARERLHIADFAFYRFAHGSAAALRVTREVS
jgi:hypothetical protein